MQLTLELAPCRKGTTLPLLPKDFSSQYQGHYRNESRYRAPIPVGTKLLAGDYALLVTSNITLVSQADPLPRAIPAQLVEALCDIPQMGSQPAPLSTTLQKEGVSLACITLSDKGSRGEREDTSGPAIAAAVGKALPLCLARQYIIPDEANVLRALLTECALTNAFDLICTSGGTGLTARDITPQTTERVLDMPLPGFVIAMMNASLAKTPRAILSRASAGILGTSLIVNLPGSRKAVEENLAAILPALEHTIAKLHNDPSDCGG